MYVYICTCRCIGRASILLRGEDKDNKRMRARLRTKMKCLHKASARCFLHKAACRLCTRLENGHKVVEYTYESMHPYIYIYITWIQGRIFRCFFQCEKGLVTKKRSLRKRSRHTNYEFFLNCLKRSRNVPCDLRCNYCSLNARSCI